MMTMMDHAYIKDEGYVKQGDLWIERESRKNDMYKGPEAEV